MNFISSERAKEKQLAEVRIEYTDCKGMRHVDWKVPDTDGVFYDAILNEDGTIRHQTGRYSGPDAFERSRAASDLIARRIRPGTESNLYRCRDTGQFFEEQWFQSVGEPLISSVTQEGAFSWFFEIGEPDQV